LEGLTWELLHLRLPQPCSCIAIFKVNGTEVYFLLDKIIYSFHTLRPVRDLAVGTKSYYGPSYHYEEKLYCSSTTGRARRLEIGRI
jgi:hypothetical protein